MNQPLNLIGVGKETGVIVTGIGMGPGGVNDLDSIHLLLKARLRSAARGKGGDEEEFRK